METAIVLLNSTTLVDCIIRDLQKTGPRWPACKRIKRMTVLYVIKYCSRLTASPGEEKWARKKIEQVVLTKASWWQVLLLKLLVNMIIDWFLKRRNADFDAAMHDVIHNLW